MPTSTTLQLFAKPALSYAEQVQRLQNNGMAIDDVSSVIEKLSTISYYRLSGYWHPLRKRDASGQVHDAFELGTSFANAIQLYEFDQQLRTLVLTAIERIEIAVRTQLTYHLAHSYGAFGYADAKNFHPQFNHSDWLSKLTDEVTHLKISS